MKHPDNPIILFIREMGWTQQDFAAIIGISYANLNATINYRHHPGEETLDKIGEFVGLSRHELFPDDQPELISIEELMDQGIEIYADDDTGFEEQELTEKCLAMLPAEERYVIEEYFYNHRTLEDIATYGIFAGYTRERIRQIKDKVLRKLREYEWKLSNNSLATKPPDKLNTRLTNANICNALSKKWNIDAWIIPSISWIPDKLEEIPAITCIPEKPPETALLSERMLTLNINYIKATNSTDTKQNAPLQFYLQSLDIYTEWLKQTWMIYTDTIINCRVYWHAKLAAMEKTLNLTIHDIRIHRKNLNDAMQHIIKLERIENEKKINEPSHDEFVKKVKAQMEAARLERERIINTPDPEPPRFRKRKHPTQSHIHKHSIIPATFTPIPQQTANERKAASEAYFKEKEQHEKEMMIMLANFAKNRHNQTPATNIA